MDAHSLPVIFIGLMGLAILIYAILDGYDLGVGILLPLGNKDEDARDLMIASIGPFWDANETWLVLAVGLMLIAFPAAHSLILFELYLPATAMLMGLIIRGVAFDFRAKVAVNLKHLWDHAFRIGSLLTSLAQGYMLGQYVTGFSSTPGSLAFSILSALGVSAAYAYIGAAWLVMKTENTLQRRAKNWALWAGRVSFMGVVSVSFVNLQLNPDVLQRWFEFPLVMFILLIPALCFSAFVANELLLRQLPRPNDTLCWLPALVVALIFALCFSGLAFSFFPYIVPGQLTIWQAASAPESLQFILVGALIVIPFILLYTLFSYRVFRGKASELQYY